MKSNKKKFPCGCEFDIVDGRVQFDPDVEKLNLECPDVWALLGSGKSTGLFQLESQLGKSFSSKLKPENIDHLAALLAIIRPGCLESKIGDKSVTRCFVDRKNKEEDVEYYHESLIEILEPTLGILVYQEQAMSIVKKLAGFDLSQADILRRAIGKKKVEEMTKVKGQFLEGCKKVGLVNDEESSSIFAAIKASQRYSFNKCLGLDVVVETPKGTKTLEEIQVGDFVDSPNGYVEVLNKYDNGTKELYEVTLEGDQTIKCTLDHKFLCGDGQVYPLGQIFKNYLEIVVQLDCEKYTNTEKIISVKPVGQYSTVDIEVDHPSHIFYANGIATSNSHAVSYAMNTYLSAYTKTHFPHEFFTSSLYYSINKPKPYEEIQSLVADAKYFDIDIRPPHLPHLNKNFKLIDNKIYFGIINIKNVGINIYKKIRTKINQALKKLNKTEIGDLIWMELLIFVLSQTTSTSTEAICGAGGLSYLSRDRKRMIYEYKKYSLLSPREQLWVQNNYEKHQWETLQDCIETLVQLPTGKNGACANKKRHELMEEIVLSLANPPYSLVDTPVYLAEREEELLGVPITCTTVEECDLSDATANCQDFLKGPKQKLYWIPAQINRKHEILTKTKKKMCFLSCSDLSGSIDSVVVFPEVYADYRVILYGKNNIMLVGSRGKDANSFIVKKIYQL